jgi:hypothetical protein
MCPSRSSNRGCLGSAATAAHTSGLDSRPTPQVLYTCPCFYNHTHRLRLEKPLHEELSRSNGHLKPLLEPGDRFHSETATRRFQKRNSRYVTAPGCLCGCRCFVYIPITTPIAPTSKNCYMQSFLEFPTDIFNHFWIQVAVSELRRL